MTGETLVLDEKSLARFKKNVEVNGEDDCCPWLGQIEKEGRGRFFANGRTRDAHVVAWELVNGVVPKGFYVLHNAGCKRSCCNVKHMYLSKCRRMFQPTLEAFLEKVQVGVGDECDLWTGAVNRGGYGSFRLNGHTMNSNRAAWILLVGPVPKGKCVLHNCPNGDNRRCCKIEHLWLGTKAENNRDRAEKGRNGDITKVSNYQVAHIRLLSKTGFYRNCDLAAMYDLNPVYVGQIVLNKKRKQKVE